MDSDSDFYGDDDEIAQLESRAASFNPATYWDDRKKLAMESPGLFNQSCSPSSSSATPTLAVAAASPSATRLSTTTTRLHNPYEGRPWCAKQLNETFENFLTRLPPSTTATTDQTPWIYVANPFIPREEDHGRRGGGGSGGEEQEAPSEFGAQIEGFMEGGAERLALLGDFLRTVEAKTGRGGLSKAVVNREVAKERDGAVNDVLMLAKMLKVRTGKWMLFVEPAFVDDVWATIARATFKNELGLAAKVSPREERGSTRERLICIYTYDFSDRDDIARVLARMKQLDLVRNGPGRKPIYYKADAFTYLGIGSGNPWGIRASIYSSTDIFSHIREKAGKIPATDVVSVKREEDSGGEWEF